MRSPYAESSNFTIIDNVCFNQNVTSMAEYLLCIQKAYKSNTQRVMLQNLE